MSSLTHVTHLHDPHCGPGARILLLKIPPSPGLAQGGHEWRPRGLRGIGRFSTGPRKSLLLKPPSPCGLSQYLLPSSPSSLSTHSEAPAEKPQRPEASSLSEFRRESLLCASPSLHQELTLRLTNKEKPQQREGLGGIWPGKQLGTQLGLFRSPAGNHTLPLWAGGKASLEEAAQRGDAERAPHQLTAGQEGSVRGGSGILS